MENDIVFVTTTLHSKWLEYHKKIININFPESEHLISNGDKNWPYSWFYWIEKVKSKNKKWYIHIDEDFFITNKNEVIKCIKKMESDNIDLLGCSDGYHHFRQNNPVAINTFFMIGKVEHLKSLDFSDIKIKWNGNSYINNYNLHFKKEYLIDFKYNHNKMADCKYNDFEPYYAFQWKMKDMGLKFDYLYPHFDEIFKSTNPRLDEQSKDIGIHMWYVRQWNSNMDVWGMKNIDRYNKIEKYLNDTLHIHNTPK